jgi:hypothetical protein
MCLKKWIGERSILSRWTKFGCRRTHRFGAVEGEGISPISHGGSSSTVIYSVTVRHTKMLYATLIVVFINASLTLHFFTFWRNQLCRKCDGEIRPMLANGVELYIVYWAIYIIYSTLMVIDAVVINSIQQYVAVFCLLSKMMMLECRWLLTINALSQLTSSKPSIWLQRQSIASPVRYGTADEGSPQMHS